MNADQQARLEKLEEASESAAVERLKHRGVINEHTSELAEARETIDRHDRELVALLAATRGHGNDLGDLDKTTERLVQQGVKLTDQVVGVTLELGTAQGGITTLAAGARILEGRVKELERDAATRLADSIELRDQLDATRTKVANLDKREEQHSRKVDKRITALEDGGGVTNEAVGFLTENVGEMRQALVDGLAALERQAKRSENEHEARLDGLKALCALNDAKAYRLDKLLAEIALELRERPELDLGEQRHRIDALTSTANEHKASLAEHKDGRRLAAERMERLEDVQADLKALVETKHAVTSLVDYSELRDRVQILRAQIDIHAFRLVTLEETAAALEARADSSAPMEGAPAAPSPMAFHCTTDVELDVDPVAQTIELHVKGYQRSIEGETPSLSEPVHLEHVVVVVFDADGDVLAYELTESADNWGRAVQLAMTAAHEAGTPHRWELFNLVAFPSPIHGHAADIPHA